MNNKRPPHSQQFIFMFSVHDGRGNESEKSKILSLSLFDCEMQHQLQQQRMTMTTDYAVTTAMAIMKIHLCIFSLC
jgi:hypothetical protein